MLEACKFRCSSRTFGLVHGPQVQDHRVEGKPPNHGSKTIGNTCSLRRQKGVGTATPHGLFPGGGDFTFCDHLVLKLLSLPQQNVTLLRYFTHPSRQVMGRLQAVFSLLPGNRYIQIMTATVTAPVLRNRRMRHTSTPILIKWKREQSIAVDDCVEDANLA